MNSFLVGDLPVDPVYHLLTPAIGMRGQTHIKLTFGRDQFLAITPAFHLGAIQ